MEARDAVDLLDRQVDYLRKLSGRDFIVELRRWVTSVQGEPPLSLHASDAVLESERLDGRFSEHERSCAKELRAIRTEFVRLAPEVDDSKTQLGSNLDPLAAIEFKNTLAYFDQLATEVDARRGGVRMTMASADDVSACLRLCTLLTNKVHNLRFTKRNGGAVSSTDDDQRADLEPVHTRLWDVRERHDRFHRELTLDKLASGGFALRRLADLVQDLNPPAHQIGRMGDVIAAQEERFLRGLKGPRDSGATLSQLLEAVFADDDRRGMDVKAKAALDAWEVHLKPFVERLYHDLRRRIGEGRALVRLVDRFKERCEWHDRDRLRELAEGTHSKENTLTAEFARWLFDQGYSPLTRPLVGDLQPDLLEPSHLYVEAKRYKDAKGRRAIVQGYWELHDGVMRTKGTKYEAREVLFLVFRESGPRYALPPEIRSGGWTTIIRLVDIAASDQSGSRQKAEPIEIPESEFLARPQPEVTPTRVQAPLAGGQAS